MVAWDAHWRIAQRLRGFCCEAGLQHANDRIDECGGRKECVRGHAKMLYHLMLSIVAITTD
jgi:hypothetical protein